MQIETFKIFCDFVETASFSKTAEMNIDYTKRGQPTNSFTREEIQSRIH